MATVTLDASLAEIVKTLDWEKVPDKLHCGACHQFNLNAYKTTCCDTYICEQCFNNAQDVNCPKCDHKPFSTDVCKPNKAMRNTIKAYLKTIEKTKMDERTKAPSSTVTPVESESAKAPQNGDGQEEEVPTPADDQQDTEAVEQEDTPTVDVQPSIEDRDPESAENLDDDVDIQVELEDDDQEIPVRALTGAENASQDQSTLPFNPKSTNPDLFNANTDGTNGMDFPNMMNGLNNVDYNQMMQMMAANGMGGFNPMMGMPMGMNPMSAGMFGGLGGANGGMNGMNGMNMGMNFNPNQGMFAGWNNQNNNMWQNNNANAFSNGMGTDLGSNFGFNMGPSGNFNPSYPNGDFQGGYYGRGGYGRGRGRGRGGYGRGRGNFNQYGAYHQQGYRNGPDQQPHYDSQRPFGDTSTEQGRASTLAADETHEDDEFAPGGQEEVQEALGEDYQKSADQDKKPQATTDDAVELAADHDMTEARKFSGEEKGPTTNGSAAHHEASSEEGVSNSTADIKPIPEAYSEDLQGPMPPPLAPLGPSAQYGSRGHGRFPSRGRGSMNNVPLNGHVGAATPPIVDSKGVGVIGAPTGPRAMREPPVAPARSTSRSATTGFQIMGRASMQAPVRSGSRDGPRARSKTPGQEYGSDRDRSRRHSRQDRPSGSTTLEGEDRQEADRRDKDRRHARPRRDVDDYDGDDGDGSYSRSDSVGGKTSSRHGRDREKSSRYHSSRSRRYEEEDAGGDHEMNDHDDSSRVPSRRDDAYYEESRTKHRTSKSSKYEERHRERDPEGPRDRRYDGEREGDRDRDRNRVSIHRDTDRADRDKRDRGDERHLERDHDGDRDRKRSRPDRHREDDDQRPHHDYDYDHEQDYADGDDQDSRHRSRRHKKDHRHGENGGPPPASAPGPDKDPHTLEREARNRERLLKEQQRREKAAKAGGGGGGPGASGRRVTYKYEDDIERGLMEGERASARWR